MEKRVPTFDLNSIKTFFSSPENLFGHITKSALYAAAAMNMDEQDIVDTIQSLDRKDFYKSMTSFNDHRIWQDVYHASFNSLLIYMKFTVQQDKAYLLISFKEK